MLSWAFDLTNEEVATYVWRIASQIQWQEAVWGDKKIRISQPMGATGSQKCKGCVEPDPVGTVEQEEKRGRGMGQEGYFIIKVLPLLTQLWSRALRHVCSVAGSAGIYFSHVLSGGTCGCPISVRLVFY